MATVAILGASGYSGQETLDRVLRHPELEVVALGSDSLAGEPAAALDVRLNGSLPAFVANDEALARGRRRRLRLPLARPCRGARSAGRHRRRRPLRRAPPARTPRSIPRGTASSIRTPAALGDWSYAVPELFPPTGSLIANPGLLRDRRDPRARAAEATRSIRRASIVDAKSGVSGAGRQLKESSHAGFVLENVSPYKVGAHQHAPEIAQALGFPVCFVPHLLPVRRGLLATCYVQPIADDLRVAARGRVRRQRRRARAAGGRRARARARAAHRRRGDRASSRTARPVTPSSICALDNLGKGAAGQALQNANLALGLDETLGLRLAGVLV